MRETIPVADADLLECIRSDAFLGRIDLESALMRRLHQVKTWESWEYAYHEGIEWRPGDQNFPRALAAANAALVAVCGGHGKGAVPEHVGKVRLCPLGDSGSRIEIRYAGNWSDHHLNDFDCNVSNKPFVEAWKAWTP